jgi:GNAT superfamily N-acetyltransferase
MRSFGVPVDAAARPQPVDRSRSRRRTSAAIKRVLARLLVREFAITVADDYQNRGAGTLLLQRLVHIARADGVRELVGHVLEDNREMLEVIRRATLPCRQTSEDGVCRVVVSLVRD